VVQNRSRFLGKKGGLGGVEFPVEGLSSAVAEEFVDHSVAHALALGADGAREVWGEDDVGQREEGRVGRGRFGVGDVEDGGEVGAAAEDVDHGGFVDEGTACSVEEEGSGAHGFEVVGLEHAFGLGEKGSVERKSVGSGEEFVEGVDFANGLALGFFGTEERVVDSDADVVAAEALADETGDFSVGDKANGGAVRSGSGRLFEAGRVRSVESARIVPEVF